MRPWILGLAMLGALAPLAAAQGDAGGVTITASPSSLEAVPGARVATTLTIHNALKEPVSLTLRASTVGADVVRFESATLELAPGATGTVQATIATDPDAKAPRLVKLGAQDAARGVKALVDLELIPIAPSAVATEPAARPTVALAEASTAVAPPSAAPSLALAAAAATAGVGTAAGALWAARRRWPWLFAALYTRLHPGKMLQSPMRARIVELVKTHPGIAFSEVQRRLDIGAGTLTHHARMLEKGGVVFSSPDGQQRRFYHVAGGYVAPKPGVGERAVHLLARGPRSMADVAKELGVSRQTLHYHVKKLVAEGKVRATQDGRDLQLAIAAA